MWTKIVAAAGIVVAVVSIMFCVIGTVCFDIIVIVVHSSSR